MCIGKCALLNSDKECLLTYGHSLNDKHINAAHALLNRQFSNAVGLQSTLLQYKVLPVKMTMRLQIVHCNECHWVTVYKDDKDSSIVKVFDSVYTSLYQLNVSTVIKNIFCFADSRPLRIELFNLQRQIANSWSVCSGSGYSHFKWPGFMYFGVQGGRNEAPPLRMF